MRKNTSSYRSLDIAKKINGKINESEVPRKKFDAGDTSMPHIDASRNIIARIVRGGGRTRNGGGGGDDDDDMRESEEWEAGGSELSRLF